MPQQYVQHGQQQYSQNQEQYVVTPQQQYEVYQNANYYQPPIPMQQEQIINYPSINNTSAQPINLEPTQYINENQIDIQTKDLYSDQDSYQISALLRLFYILKLIVALYFVAFLIFNTVGKYNNQFKLFSDPSSPVNSLNNTETTYTYYLARNELYKYDCDSLDNKYYGELIDNNQQGFFITILVMILIWKVYYISFLLVEIHQCTIRGKITYLFRNDIRQRDCCNFILDYISSVTLSPFTAFIFSQVNCSSWKYGDKNVIVYPVFFYYNSVIWFFATFLCVLGLFIKKKEGYNIRPFGIFMIVPFLTYMIFSICTHLKPSETIYKVTVYDQNKQVVDTYYETRGDCFIIICKLIGLIGQFLIPFYQILGMILQLPYMVYYTPIYLIVYYCLQIVIFFITIKVHKRLGY